MRVLTAPHGLAHARMHAFARVDKLKRGSEIKQEIPIDAEGY